MYSPGQMYVSCYALQNQSTDVGPSFTGRLVGFSRRGVERRAAYVTFGAKSGHQYYTLSAISLQLQDFKNIIISFY